MNSSSNGGSDITVFLVLGCVGAFAVLLCWIAACCVIESRQDTPNASQTLQPAPAAVNGGSVEKDGNLTIDVMEPAVAAIEIAAEVGRGVSIGCCCGGGGDGGGGDGGGCGGCGGCGG